MDIKITKTTNPKAKPTDVSKLGFGQFFSDHMFLMDYDEGVGWHDPRIEPYHNFELDPACVIFHYAQEIFEGMKAYKTAEGKIQLFRPDCNARRMQDSADQAVYFRPLDTVEMYVSHPNYPAVSVRQVLPCKTEGRVVRCYPMQEGWIALDIELDPYHGNPDDMIGIGILLGSALMANKSDTADKQTEILNLEYLYSTSADFAQAQNLQSEGYYAGSHGEFLFLPASALQDTLRLSLFADGWQLNNKREYINRNNYYPVGIRDLTLEVRAYTHDSYLYEVFRRNSTGVQLPPPSGVPTQNGNIVQEILEEIASALGGQEMIPPFTNVEGGLGCFRAYSYSYIIAEPNRVLPCTPSTTP